MVICVQWTRKPTVRVWEARTLMGSGGGTAHSATTTVSHGRVNSIHTCAHP